MKRELFELVERLSFVTEDKFIIEESGDHYMIYNDITYEYFVCGSLDFCINYIKIFINGYECALYSICDFLGLVIEEEYKK